MAKKLLRWGMIGTGNVTELKSAPSFTKIEDSRLMAVANRSPEKAEDYAHRHGIPAWHRDPYEVIRDPEVDMVYVATPPGSHADYALECIRAGKPVYLEKPMARTWEECQIINEAARTAGVPVFVAYYRRAQQPFLKIKSLLDEGAIGQPRLVNIMPVMVEENLVSPAVSTIPQMATRPVKASATSSNGFLNIASPLRQPLIY